MESTWDGLPIADDLPTGTVVAVFRRRDECIEWLVLHRAHRGPAFDGDWAWGAPSGCRLPGEAVEDCAHRELFEETGLDSSPAPLLHDDEWPLFMVEAPTGTEVRLSREHDAYRWVDLLTACGLIKPELVAEQLRRAARLLQSSGTWSAT
jgi:8-oxo-dGTP pyrophosphatase MutT (NUDIX family)